MVSAHQTPTCNTLIISNSKNIILAQTWSRCCCSLHSVKALALPESSGTATRSPTLKCIHLYKPFICTCWEAGTEGGVHVDTSRRTFAVALFSTLRLNLRDSYTVKVKALANAFVYVHPTHSMRQKRIFCVEREQR